MDRTENATSHTFCCVRVRWGDHVIATDQLHSNAYLCWLQNSALSKYATVFYQLSDILSGLSSSSSSSSSIFAFPFVLFL
jgi:hypothetical protein